MSEQPITLTKREFPYFVQNPGVPVSSLMRVSYTRTSEEYFERDGEQVLFWLVNAELQVSTDMHSPRSFIKVRHEFARDDEGDGAYIAYFDVASVQFVSSYDNTLNFTGWLTDVPKFWPEGEPSPFVDIEREEEPKEGEEFFYANSGYPYIPPAVNIPGLKTPMMVEISITHGSEEHMGDWLKRIREGVEERKVERAEKARLAEEKAAADKAERERRHALTAQYCDTHEDGEELRNLAAELQRVRGDEKRAFFDEGKYDRLQELRGALYDWLDNQPESV